jgi:hypothetical protein
VISCDIGIHSCSWLQVLVLDQPYMEEEICARETCAGRNLFKFLLQLSDKNSISSLRET